MAISHRVDRVRAAFREVRALAHKIQRLIRPARCCSRQSAPRIAGASRWAIGWRSDSRDAGASAAAEGWHSTCSRRRHMLIDTNRLGKWRIRVPQHEGTLLNALLAHACRPLAANIVSRRDKARPVGLVASDERSTGLSR